VPDAVAQVLLAADAMPDEKEAGPIMQR